MTQHNPTLRNIQVDAETCEALCRSAQTRPTDAPLFTHEDGRPWNTGEVDDRMKKVRKVATENGDPIRGHITPYSFRHLYISELLMIGAEPFKVAKMAGTSLTELERTYGHFFNHDLAAAQERLAATRRARRSCHAEPSSQSECA